MQGKPKTSTVNCLLIVTILVTFALHDRQGMAQDDRATSLSLSNVLRIEKNASSRVTAVIIDESASVPRHLVDLLPTNDSRKLLKAEIKRLAAKHRLFTEWDVNPGLRFQDGDVSYWFEQELSASNVELQLLARRIVIEQAEAANATIPSQGDLSALSSPVFSWLHKAAVAKWANRTSLLHDRQGIAQDDRATSLSLSNVLRIEKNASSRVTAVTIDESASVPRQLVDLLPAKDTRKLTKPEIKKLAAKHRLFTEWKVNPGLHFQDGDVSYWFEQELSASNVELQLLARRIVIEQAETANATIPSQGDLSALSSPVFSWLHKAAVAKWANRTSSTPKQKKD